MQIDENYVAKVADFGLSKESNKTAGVTVGDVGTVNWCVWPPVRRAERGS